MSEAVSVSGSVTNGDGPELTLETGKLAGLASGSVVARMGDTTVLVAATGAKHVRDGIDFFPLTVDVEERSYAAGKIPGSFFRREGRASDAATLTCRLIDRPLRPSFPSDYRNETHVVVTVLSADQKVPHDVLAINGASAALMVSNVPLMAQLAPSASATQPMANGSLTPPTKRVTRDPSRSSLLDVSSTTALSL